MTNATIVLFIPTVKLVKGKVCCFVISTIYIIITVTVPEKSRLSLKECCTAESICAIFMGLGWRLIKITKVPNSARKTCRNFPYQFFGCLVGRLAKNKPIMTVCVLIISWACHNLWTNKILRGSGYLSACLNTLLSKSRCYQANTNECRCTN